MEGKIDFPMMTDEQLAESYRLNRTRMNQIVDALIGRGYTFTSKVTGQTLKRLSGDEVKITKVKDI